MNLALKSYACTMEENSFVASHNDVISLNSMKIVCDSFELAGRSQVGIKPSHRSEAIFLPVIALFTKTNRLF